MLMATPISPVRQRKASVCRLRSAGRRHTDPRPSRFRRLACLGQRMCCKAHRANVGSESVLEERQFIWSR